MGTMVDNTIRIYWKLLGGHIHCRVFMSGSMNGTLVFDEAEWEQWQSRVTADFIEE
jgi:hypothetical protein